MKTNSRISQAAARMVAAIALAAGLLATPTASAASSLVVNDDPPGRRSKTLVCQTAPQYTSIQAALGDAGEGDKVIVCPSTYHQDLRLHQSNVTLTAADLNKKLMLF